MNFSVWPIKSLLKLFLVIFVLVNTIHAKDIRFTHISSEQGLSQNSVYDIIQDHNGFMWFATQDGLNKFDGYNFTPYKYKPSQPNPLPSNRVHTVYEDKQGFIWLGTPLGLVKFDPQSQTFTTYINPLDPDSPSANNAFLIIEDSAHCLWLKTFVGIYRFDKQTTTFSRIFVEPAEVEPVNIASQEQGRARFEAISSIYTDKANNLWVGTPKGLHKFNFQTQQFSHYRPYPQDLDNALLNNVHAIYEDHNGIFWLSTKRTGLSKFDRQTETFTPVIPPQNLHDIDTTIINSITEDKEGNIWLGTTEGLYLYNLQTQEFSAYYNNPKDSQSLSANFIHTVYTDKEGIIWVGTEGKGLNKLNLHSQRFMLYQNKPEDPQSLSNGMVFPLLASKDGVIWIGNERGELNRFDPETGTFSVYKVSSNRSLRLFSLLEDPEGIIWIGTNEGMILFDKKKHEVVPHHWPSNFLLSEPIQHIYRDHLGNIWVASTTEGLFKLDPKTNTLIYNYKATQTNPQSLSSNATDYVYEDSLGNIWIGTFDGLNRLDINSGEITIYKHDPQNPHSLSHNNIFSIFQDHTGTLWFTTFGGGINKFDPKNQQFTYFTEDEGLPNNAVYGMLEDNEGNLWCSTNRGICRFNPQNNRVTNYGVEDGLQGEEFNSKSFCQAPNGDMYFGGINGLTRFNPQDLKEKPYSPPVQITNFKLFNNVLVKANQAIAQANGEAIPLVELAYNENSISLDFVAFSYRHPEKLQYRYMLGGEEEKWIYCGAGRSASFKLEPGEYLFQVASSTGDGVWTAQPSKVKIKISPPFWRTYWAYLTYFLLFTSIAYGTHRYYVKALEQNNRLERAAEINQKNEELNKKNEELAGQYSELNQMNVALADRYEELNQKNQELIESNRRADRIFSALAEALPGTVLDDKYRLEEKIGAGGFGAVYRATHLAMRKPIAVKIFKPAPGNDSADALERFQQEAISTSRITHPNAVAVLDSGISSEGIAYLVMELLEGYSLKAEMSETGQLTVARATELILPVCDVLAKAHSIGIIHRDIKPDNIFLHHSNEGEVVKLVDFGIAKFTQATNSLDIKDITAGGIIGTPMYMAPERLLGDAYDGKADIYSVGVVLYEMLCGQPPFLIDSQYFLIILQQLSKQPTPLKEYVADIPEAIEQLVLSCLDKDMSKRPTAKELAEQLSNITGITFHATLTTTSKLTINKDFQEAQTLRVPTPANNGSGGRLLTNTTNSTMKESATLIRNNI